MAPEQKVGFLGAPGSFKKQDEVGVPGGHPKPLGRFPDHDVGWGWEGTEGGQGPQTALRQWVQGRLGGSGSQTSNAWFPLRS